MREDLRGNVIGIAFILTMVSVICGTILQCQTM